MTYGLNCGGYMPILVISHTLIPRKTSTNELNHVKYDIIRVWGIHCDAQNPTLPLYRGICRLLCTHHNLETIPLLGMMADFNSPISRNTSQKFTINHLKLGRNSWRVDEVYEKVERAGHQHFLRTYQGKCPSYMNALHIAPPSRTQGKNHTNSIWNQQPRAFLLDG